MHTYIFKALRGLMLYELQSISVIMGLSIVQTGESWVNPWGSLLLWHSSALTPSLLF